MRYLNVAGYRFFSFENDLTPIRGSLREDCRSKKLKGTILLSPEGINCFLAGEERSVREVIQKLRNLTPNQDIIFKESWSNHLPFTRMLVKIKPQIIPAKPNDFFPSEKELRVSPEKLKEWIETKQDFVLLDTRNDYETRVGSFKNAETLPMKHFRDYFQLLDQAPEDWKEKPVVTFCTGGIRCEKAVPLMKRKGFKEVYQLDGGILKYFEKIGGDHFQGDCFVFDRRVALNPKLEETETVECYNCRNPITPYEQTQKTYRKGESCPHCFGKEKNSWIKG